ncbi:MAG TPA: zf-HC2 domain-containing protein [Anaerolineales bacterium]|nr:zf-HC2 domain-containing protein [Anaerolineales bacterium]
MSKVTNHIPFRHLVDYVEGNLPLDMRVDLELHVADCSRCAGELAQLERLVALMRTDTSQDASASVIQRAVDLFRPRTVRTSISSGLHGRILAALHFDSLGLAPAFGVRSGKPGVRQLLFHGGLDEIDLRIEPTGEAWTVSGQVLGKSTAYGRAILQGAVSISQAVLNELSEFTLPPVQAGTYKLILSLADVDVEIEEIRIGS